jgi:hypothetical protein
MTTSQRFERKQMAKTGRPTLYTEELVEEICTRVANGIPLRVICREEGKPSWTTFYNWINSDKTLYERFARARDLGSDAIAEEALEIIDEIPLRTGDKTNSRVDAGYVHWQRNRAEMRLKLLAKWNPRKYGDRQVVAGDPEAPLAVTQSTTLDEVILNFERKRQLQNESKD